MKRKSVPWLLDHLAATSRISFFALPNSSTSNSQLTMHDSYTLVSPHLWVTICDSKN